MTETHPKVDSRDPSTIALDGVIELEQSRELERQVLRAVIAGHRHVHVDLSGVTQIRAGLVGALLRVQRGLRRVDGSLTVIAPLPPAADMVRAARLDLLMDVTTSVGAAPQPATTWPGHGR